MRCLHEGASRKNLLKGNRLRQPPRQTADDAKVPELTAAAAPAVTATRRNATLCNDFGERNDRKSEHVHHRTVVKACIVLDVSRKDTKDVHSAVRPSTVIDWLLEQDKSKIGQEISVEQAFQGSSEVFK